MAEDWPRQNRVLELYRGLPVTLDFSGLCSKNALLTPIRSFCTSKTLKIEKSVKTGKTVDFEPDPQNRKNPYEFGLFDFFAYRSRPKGVEISKNENFEIFF